VEIRWSGCLVSVLGLLLFILACTYAAAVYQVGLFLVLLDVVLKFVGVATQAGEDKAFAQLFYILLALAAGVLLMSIGLVRAFAGRKPQGPVPAEWALGTAEDGAEPRAPGGPAR